MTPEHAQRILMDLMTQWLSPKEQRQLWVTGREEVRRFDARKIIVKKLLEVPERGREMALAFINEGVTPQEYTAWITTLFRWIDAHAESVQEADSAITRLCSGCDLEWHRVPGGYLIRPMSGDPETIH